MRSTAVLATTLAAVLALGSAAFAGAVLLNGTALPEASATVDASQEMVEPRDGAAPNERRPVLGPKRYGVCLVTPDPVASLDAEVPVTGTPSRFTITVEDGRRLENCLLASFTSNGIGAKRRFTYCLRCEHAISP
jgi:hypothetical protein